MKEMVVDKEFWDVFPEAQINVLVVKGITNQFADEEKVNFTKLLSEAKKEAAQYLTKDSFSQNDVIQEWREAFRKFKIKKGARSSIEALLKRVDQGREFSPISPLVDIYNIVSIKYAVPCGGEDLHAIKGNLHLGKAEGGEPFLPLGAEEDAPALPGEIIYYDNEGAVCRCFNWREAQRTMLTEDTTDAVLVIEAINAKQADRAAQAVKELKQLVDAYFETESVVFTADKTSSTFNISFE